MKNGDVVMVINCETIPDSFLGSFGVVRETDEYKVTVEFKGFVNGRGSFCHTAIVSDLKKIGETF